MGTMFWALGLPLTLLCHPGTVSLLVMGREPACSRREYLQLGAVAAWGPRAPGCVWGCRLMVGAPKASDPLLLGPQLVVAGFSTHVEIARAHEIANEVRRVKKQLKDCQQLAMLYNNRERILGLPITNVGLLRACRLLGPGA